MYSKYQQAPQDNLMAEIATNSKEAMRLAVEAKSLMRQLSDIKVKFKRITEEVLPALQEKTNGQKEFLVETKKIKFPTVITANCPAPTTKEPELQKRRVRIFQWLDEHHYGKIINREFRIYLGREEKDREQAKLVQEFVRENSIPSKAHHAIHHSTMNSFAKQCMEAGVDLPDFFQARSFVVAKLPPEYNVKWSQIGSASSEDGDDAED